MRGRSPAPGIATIGDDGGFSIDNVQFYDLDEGTLVTSINTTIQPVGAGSVGVTHSTGAINAEGTNPVVGGDYDFRNAQSRVRLNGAVDMSLFGSDNIITFDCIFRIDFDHAIDFDDESDGD